MSSPAFSEDHIDALQETANLAMGEAGADLANALDTFIELSVPQVRVADAEHIVGIMGDWTDEFGQIVSVVRQGFDGLLSGEALLIFNEGGLRAIADILGDGDDFDPSMERELLLDMGNIIAGACVNGLAKNLNGKMNVSAPTIFCQRMAIQEVFGSVFSKKNIRWTKTVIVRISFTLEDKDFQCDLLIFFSERSLEKLVEALDQLLEQC